MTNQLSTELLDPIQTDQFLPTVSRWVTLGSWFVVLALGSAIAASFSVKYRTTVKVPAQIRPAGEPRLVQATTTGKVVNIQVSSNTPVQKGDIIAQLDSSSAEARAVQLLANLDQGKQRLMQINAQLATTDQQLAAEIAQAQRTVLATAADYRQARRNNQDQGIAAQAAVQEAQAQIDLATRELDSYSQLVDSGAISQIQVYEKEAALEAAKARMVSLEAALNPSTGDVQAAQERIAQAQAGGAATLARLQQSKQQLVQQGLEIQDQLQGIEQEIAQVNLELQNATVRSPTTGILHELRLRNIGQVVGPGETIAQVVPANSPVEIRAMVPAQQINKVEIGLSTQMRVSACPFSEFGTLEGTVKSISPDTVSQPVSNGGLSASMSAPPGSFYSVLIETETPALISSRSNQQCAIQPGTEGQATIISSEETIITFLLRKAQLATNF